MPLKGSDANRRAAIISGIVSAASIALTQRSDASCVYPVRSDRPGFVRRIVHSPEGTSATYPHSNGFLADGRLVLARQAKNEISYQLFDLDSPSLSKPAISIPDARTFFSVSRNGLLAATEIAGWRENDEESPIENGYFLYQTRFGAFLIYEYEDDGPGEDNYDKIRPLTAADAQAWLEKHYAYDIELIERLFGKMPEAGSGESKFTLRMPDSLRERLADLAKTNGQSLNAWIIRCLETSATDTDGQRDVPPMGNLVGSNRNGWRSGRS